MYIFIYIHILHIGFKIYLYIYIRTLYCRSHVYVHRQTCRNTYVCVHNHVSIVDLCMLCTYRRCSTLFALFNALFNAFFRIRRYVYTGTLVYVYTYFGQCHSTSESVCLSHHGKLLKMNISFHLRYQHDTDKWR